jgi:hypothetical protein
VIQICETEKKIGICHSRPQGNPQSIEVSCEEQTLCDHQGHGDDLTLRSCEEE